MRITREKVEQLMVTEWDNGYAEGIEEGKRQALAVKEARVKGRVKALDGISDSLDHVESKKSAAG